MTSSSSQPRSNGVFAQGTDGAGPPPHIQLFDRLRRACVVTIGKFDGVHAGHRRVLRTAADEAASLGVPLFALTFDPRPDRLFAGDGALPDLMTLDERIRALEQAGADRVVVISFTPDFARIPSNEFARDLVEHLGMVALCVGEDFALGRGRTGDVASLRRMGLDVIAVPLVVCPGSKEKLSSEALRAQVAAGAVPRETQAAR